MDSQKFIRTFLRIKPPNAEVFPYQVSTSDGGNKDTRLQHQVLLPSVGTQPFYFDGVFDANATQVCPKISI